MEEVKIEHSMVDSLRSIVDASKTKTVKPPPNLSDRPKIDVLKEARSLKVMFTRNLIPIVGHIIDNAVMLGFRNN